MARGKTHSPETKAAVLAALFGGMGLAEAAQKYKVSKATAANWKRQFGPVKPDQRAGADLEIGELLVDCVREILQTVAVQSRFARSESWFKEQTGADIAAYQGAALDRVVRILSALEPAEPSNPGSSSNESA